MSYTAAQTESGWRRFWNQGRWWKAVLAAVLYLGVCLGAGLMIGLLWAEDVGRNVLDDPLTVVVAVAGGHRQHADLGSGCQFGWLVA
ncbi:hypothetical protein [Glutamicibacter sp. NPDC087344]|uniref:hypothetical protein n=1 Tax=Glutamicibacter sp. NPDC087344 TaxID=3363994 RepID=UPI003804D476